jgi:hypothetical protein
MGTQITADTVIVTDEPDSIGSVEIVGTASRQQDGRWLVRRLGMIEIGTADSPQAAAAMILKDAAKRSPNERIQAWTEALPI